MLCMMKPPNATLLHLPILQREGRARQGTSTGPSSAAPCTCASTVRGFTTRLQCTPAVTRWRSDPVDDPGHLGFHHVADMMESKGPAHCDAPGAAGLYVPLASARLLSICQLQRGAVPRGASLNNRIR